MQPVEGGIVEELLVGDGEAAEVMAAQERTFRARAGRVVQPSWPRSSSSPSPFVKSRISGNAAADAEWTLRLNGSDASDRSAVNGSDSQGMMSHHRMDDAAYKRMFSRPRMVQDLLHGFAARDWSGALDFASLTPLPASYVSRDLQQRHGDLVWRIRFGGERWLYLVLLLEFQSGVDRAMAVRMLTYSGLLYQRLVGEGVLRERGALPPVLPVVIYNGRSPWTAPADVSELIATGGPSLARYQPAQQYFLLDEGRMDGGALPPGNLVSALIELETNREPVAAAGVAGHVDRAVAGAGRRGVDGRVHRLGRPGAAATADAGNGLGAVAEARGGAHDAGGECAGVDRAVGRAGNRARA